jgi:hypothetical protein
MHWLYQAILDRCGSRKLWQFAAAVAIGAIAVATHGARSGKSPLEVLFFAAFGAILGGVAGAILIACDVAAQRHAAGKPPLLPVWCTVLIILGCFALFALAIGRLDDLLKSR